MRSRLRPSPATEATRAVNGAVLDSLPLAETADFEDVTLTIRDAKGDVVWDHRGRRSRRCVRCAAHTFPFWFDIVTP